MYPELYEGEGSRIEASRSRVQPEKQKPISSRWGPVMEEQGVYKSLSTFTLLVALSSFQAQRLP